MSRTSVIRVNRAVAEAEAFGPHAGLALLDEVEGSENWHLFWSTRADLLRRSGDPEGAVEAYDRALVCAMNDFDRHFLEERLSELA